MSALNQLEQVRLRLSEEEAEIRGLQSELAPLLIGAEKPSNEDIQYLKEVYIDVATKVQLMPELMKAIIAASSQVPGGTSVEITRVEKLGQQCSKLKADLETKFPHVKPAPKVAAVIHNSPKTGGNSFSGNGFQPQ